MTIRKSLIVITAAACILGAGCATETRTEREFGDAVRAVKTSQIHDMGAAQYPSEDAVTGGNPERLEKVVRSHVENVGQAEQVKTAVRVGASSSSSGSN